MDDTKKSPTTPTTKPSRRVRLFKTLLKTFGPDQPSTEKSETVRTLLHLVASLFLSSPRFLLFSQHACLIPTSDIHNEYITHDFLLHIPTHKRMYNLHLLITTPPTYIWLQKEETEDLTVLFESEGQIKAATLEKLVERITHESFTSGSISCLYSLSLLLICSQIQTFCLISW